jgi:hypothetical protein
MKIGALSIKNCLSFCEKGLNEKNHIQLGDFNLFIGSNNAGKSNVLKLIEILRIVLSSTRESRNESLQDFPLILVKQPIDFKDWLFGQESKSKMGFSFSLEIGQADQIVQPYDQRDKNPVWFMFELKNDWPKVIKLSGVIEQKETYYSVTITRVEIPNDHGAYRKDPILFDRDNKKILTLALDTSGRPDKKVWRIVQHRDETQWGNYYAPVGKAVYSFLAQLYDKVFKDLLINVPAIRDIQPLGDEIVESLLRLRDGIPKVRRLHDSVVDYIKTLVFIAESQEISFVYPEEKGKHSIRIQVGEELQLPLAHYGSGVEQMLVLAAEIVRHGQNKVILIEEPEAHFYPDLQRKFMRFLWKNQKNFGHQYLIATHSNVFIDEFANMQGNVFYVYLEQSEGIQQKYSQVEPLNRANLQALFKDLGVKPSDLLLANGILVVEGATDEDVYTDWARKIGKPFERIALEVVDAEGAGNISKYLGSDVMQRTCFTNYGLCDKNAEDKIREKLKGIVADENIIALQKGDLEDYYPRELILQFAREWGKIKNRKEDEIPSEIKEGETVEKLNKLLGKEWWKKPLSEKVIKEMEPEQIDPEIKSKLTQIYDAIY